MAPSPAPLHMLPVLHMERQDDHGTALEIMLEIVLLEGRNHAFAVHHERQPSWLPTLAAKVYAYWRQNSTPITHHPRTMSHSEPSVQTTPSTVRTLLPQLVPALAQPLLAKTLLAQPPPVWTGPCSADDSTSVRVFATPSSEDELKRPPPNVRGSSYPLSPAHGEPAVGALRGHVPRLPMKSRRQAA